MARPTETTSAIPQATHLQFLVLDRLLASDATQDDLHVMLTNNKVIVARPAVCRLLGRLMRLGWVTSMWVKGPGPKKLYAVTPEGEQRLAYAVDFYRRSYSATKFKPKN